MPKIHPSVANKTPLEIQFINPYYCNASLKELLRVKFGIRRQECNVVVINSPAYPDCKVEVSVPGIMPEKLIRKAEKLGSSGGRLDAITLPVNKWMEIYKAYM